MVKSFYYNNNMVESFFNINEDNIYILIYIIAAVVVFISLILLSYAIYAFYN